MASEQKRVKTGKHPKKYVATSFRAEPREPAHLERLAHLEHLERLAAGELSFHATKKGGRSPL